MSTTRLRDDVARLSGFAGRDLDAMWRRVASAAQAQRALEDVLPALIETYGMASAALAAEWYDDERRKAGVGGGFESYPARLPDPSFEARSLSTWAAATATSINTMPGLVLGGVRRRIADAARLTVMGSSIADPKARGWKRVGNPRCDFCRRLISRGAVYSESTVQFRAHDSCGCSAAPAWA